MIMLTNTQKSAKKCKPRYLAKCCNNREKVLGVKPSRGVQDSGESINHLTIRTTLILV